MAPIALGRSKTWASFALDGGERFWLSTLSGTSTWNAVPLGPLAGEMTTATSTYREPLGARSCGRGRS